MTVSSYDEAAGQTVIQHEDPLPPCTIPGGSGFSVDGEAVAFEPGMYPEFDDLASAEEWAGDIARDYRRPVYLGYVRGRAGHRKIGEWSQQKDALATVLSFRGEVKIIR